MEEYAMEILSLVPGRVRIGAKAWKGLSRQRIEAELRRLPGVVDVQANPITGNVLVRYEPGRTGVDAILAAVESPPAADEPAAASLSPLGQVAVRGLVGHACVDAVYFTAGFVGMSLGLPLAGLLGPLHIVFDLAVWGTALTSVGVAGRPQRAAEKPLSLPRRLLQSAARDLRRAKRAS
jgi:hypothetical protein